MMSNHFKHSLKVIGLTVVALLGVFFWLKHGIERIIHLPVIPGHTGLASDERELVSFNEKTHRVTVITSSAAIKMYARNPTVRIKKDGRVVVDRHMFGFQNRYALGVGYSDVTRGTLSYNPLYWGPFEASVSAGFSLDKNYAFVKPYVGLGYNFYGNLLINGGVNPVSLFGKEVDYIAFLSVKI